MAKKKSKQTQTPPPKETPSGETGKKGPIDAATRKAGRSAVAQSSSWTGKLPGSLLHEHCQKQKWQKVEYDMKKTKDGFIGIAKLAWKNPKTQETIEVRMVPSQVIKPQETALEARHYAATYALHRIASDKNIHMVLPTNHKQLWADLEAERKNLVKQDPEKAKREYCSDPFSMILEQRKMQEKRQKEQEARRQADLKNKKPVISIGVSKPQPQVSRTEKYVSDQMRFPRKVWDNTVFIDLRPEIRALVEDCIRHHIGWSEEQIEGENSKVDAKALEALGFRKLHVAESLKYTNTFTDALEWLIFHIPEDDLPPLFVKDSKDSNVELTISKDFKKENIVKRLREGGFSVNQIETAISACGYDEILLGAYLTSTLIDFETDAQEPDSAEIWQEELDGLVAIYGDEKVKRLKENIAEVSLHPEGIDEGLLALKVYKSPNYPQSFPGLHLVVKNSSYKLANYIKISIITRLLFYIVENNVLGMPMIFNCIEWLEQNILQIVENPGPLVKATVKRERRPTESTSSFKNVKRQRPKISRDLNRLSSDYAARIQLSEYKEMVGKRAKLPAWQKKEQLVSVINSNRICLITGETGSGKSTQIVQFILDQLNSQNDFSTNIICTQPRRISTIGLADRISDERVSTCGSEVGYIIRGENKTSKDTRITFVTTGVLLRMIQGIVSNKDANSTLFENLGYIFVDEVHERSVDGDFLLIILKKILKMYPKLKVVLMSATIDISVFDKYFESGVSHVHIEGRTFPIQDYYLNDILEDLQFTVTMRNGDEIQPKADSKYFELGNINYDLIAALVEKIDADLRAQSNNGSILIFLPGVMEISKCLAKINGPFWTLPLHSALSSKDQKRIFRPPPQGKRKVVASTNVAETSITIPDAVVVIDTGRVKSVHFDSASNSTKLVESWASQAECGQRRGRAGRIQNGFCYKLFTKETETKTMRKHPIPEIKRTRLENLYLVVKSMGIKNVHDFLKLGLDPPDVENVESSKQLLTEMGALHNDNLTKLGSYLSTLPTDLKSGKLLLFGVLFKCLDSCLTLAAIGVTGNPFMVRMENRDEVKRVQNKFAKGYGDFIAILNAFNEYQNLEPRNQRRWLEENYLSYLTMNEIQSTRTQYISALQDLGFIPMDYLRSKSSIILNKNSANYQILSSLICSSAYPQIARVQYPDPKYMASVAGSISLDPDAKSIKFWIRNEKYIKNHDDQLPATRAFLHPSSTLFSVKNSAGSGGEPLVEDENGNVVFTPTESNNLTSHFVTYGASHTTTKLYIKDVTPVSILAVLLFGGSISYDLSTVSSGKPSPGVVMGQWLPIRTWCKNAVLITKMRHLLDEALNERFSQPHYDQMNEFSDEVLKTVEKIIAMELK
ncbi:hypothetical protein KL921_003093 [Ogataea angusta]|nr:hypothetical protein KL921_003093 [Ogataea angusta]